MFNLLVSKNVGKILKRKDSDAGERGKTLEDIQSSLFNELHSSKGARRHQQRICGPTMALTFNFFVSVGIILINWLVHIFSLHFVMYFFRNIFPKGFFLSHATYVSNFEIY